MTTRRSFVKKSSMAAGAILMNPLGSCSPDTKTLTGMVSGPDMALGHRLRELSRSIPDTVVHEDIVIIGGGVAGLSAARWLTNNGQSFKLLELENETGGNSRSGSNQFGRFPLGAHYLPIPSSSHSPLLKFLEECNVITGYENKLPVFNEYYLCFDPKERLFIEHHWQDGLIPHDGLTPGEQDDIKAFLDVMQYYRDLVGDDGKFAFDIPVDNSSEDKAIRKLDTITMEQFLKDKGLTSEPLRWYVNYCCADDFGASIGEASAWAGIHYFASRKGKAANAGIEDVLTWPEGNAFLIDRLRKNIEGRITHKAVALGVTIENGAVNVDYFDAARNALVRIKSKAVIVAAPSYVARHLVRHKRELNYDAFQYAPWMVANITVDSWMNERRGDRLAWDNVIYGSNSLGYVLSQHQSLTTPLREKTITYYRALTGADCALTRKVAMSTQWDSWRDSVLHDLQIPHPDFEKYASQMDVWIWGHGMIRPNPGLIWGADRQLARQPVENKIFFAHSDLSGISIFEEAFEGGIRAATDLMKSA